MSWTTFPAWRKLARRSSRLPVGKHQNLMPYLQKSTKQEELSCCINSHGSFSQSEMKAKFHSGSKMSLLLISTSEMTTGDHVTTTEVFPSSPLPVIFWPVCNSIVSHLEQDPHLFPESQVGFLASRGTVDMIFAARQLQEKCLEQTTELYTTAVDSTKAYDTVNKYGPWKIMKKFGCPNKTVTVV